MKCCLLSHTRRERTEFRKPRPASRFGFTIIEAMVVVLILGIALAIALPAYTSSQNMAKRKACEANMAAIFQAEEAYRVRNRTYTTSLTGATGLGSTMGGLPTCPCGATAYTATVSGSGANLTVTITCNNTGAHITGQKLTTSNGATFVGVVP